MLACLAAGVGLRRLRLLTRVRRFTEEAFAAPAEADVPSVPRTRVLAAAVVGVPNAGKSTLTNALAGAKVVAVSPRTNTTVLPLLGAFTAGDAQVTLHDTPGVVARTAARGPTHARRVASAWATARDADAVLLVVDAARQAARPDARVVALAAALAGGPSGAADPGWACPPATLVLNKIDLIPRAAREVALAAVAGPLLDVAAFAGGVHAVSAERGTGVAGLKDALIAATHPGPWTLPAGAATDRGPAALALEVVREKLFRRLRQELPYDIRLRLVHWHDCADGAARVEVDVLAPRESARRVVVGARGRVVGEVGITARRDLEALLARRVHLILNVRVDRGADIVDGVHLGREAASAPSTPPTSALLPPH